MNPAEVDSPLLAIYTSAPSCHAPLALRVVVGDTDFLGLKPQAIMWRAYGAGLMMPLCEVMGLGVVVSKPKSKPKPKPKREQGTRQTFMREYSETDACSEG